MTVAKFFLFLILLFGIGCQKKSSVAREPRLRLALVKDPLTLDPRKNSDPMSCQVISLLFEGLTKLDADGNPSLALAKSLSISEDKLTYTFKLKNSLWSDGHKLRAQDFEYSWLSLLNPNFPSLNAYFLFCIKNAYQAKKGLEDLDRVGVVAVDDETLVIRLERPCPYFLKTLAFCTFFPVPKHRLEKDTNFFQKKNSELISNGPFILDSWKQNNQLILKKNPHYLDQQEITLQHIHFSILPDAYTRLNLFQKEKLDFLGGFTTPIPIDALESLKKSPNYYSKALAGTICCFFNTRTFPFNNTHIRKAFFYSIDRPDIATYLDPCSLSPAYGLIPSILNKQSSKLLPEGSKELAQNHLKLGLKELGIQKKDLNHLTFSYFTYSSNGLIAQELQHSWQKNLGISIRLEALDIKVFLSKINKKNFHFCLMSILAQYNDPYNYLERFISAESSKNYSSFENAKYQNLLLILNECRDENSRLKLITKAESLLLSDLPFGPLFHCSNTYLKQSYINEPNISAISLIDFSRVRFD